VYVQKVFADDLRKVLEHARGASYAEIRYHSRLLSEIKKGVMINRFSGNVNPVNGDFSGVVKGGHLIKNGSVVCPVKEVMVAGNVFDSLKNISGLSRERKKIFDSFLPYIAVEGISFTGG